MKPQQDGSASVFGGPVPPEALMRWQSDGKVHVVGLVELYGAVVALRPRIRQKEGGRFQRSCAYFTNMFPILVLHILSIFLGVPFKGQ